MVVAYAGIQKIIYKEISASDAVNFPPLNKYQVKPLLFFDIFIVSIMHLVVFIGITIIYLDALQQCDGPI